MIMIQIQVDYHHLIHMHMQYLI